MVFGSLRPDSNPGRENQWFSRFSRGENFTCSEQSGRFPQNLASIRTAKTQKDDYQSFLKAEGIQHTVLGSGNEVSGNVCGLRPYTG